RECLSCGRNDLVGVHVCTGTRARFGGRWVVMQRCAGFGLVVLVVLVVLVLVGGAQHLHGGGEAAGGARVPPAFRARPRKAGVSGSSLRSGGTHGGPCGGSGCDTLFVAPRAAVRHGAEGRPGRRELPLPADPPTDPQLPAIPHPSGSGGPPAGRRRRSHRQTAAKKRQGRAPERPPGSGRPPRLPAARRALRTAHSDFAGIGAADLRSARWSPRLGRMKDEAAERAEADRALDEPGARRIAAKAELRAADEALRPIVFRAMKAGVPIRQIAKKTGLTTTTVMLWGKE